MYRLKKENIISTDGKATVQADKDKFKINIDGKSTQATRSGKNKFNIDILPSRIYSGGTFTQNTTAISKYSVTGNRIQATDAPLHTTIPGSRIDTSVDKTFTISFFTDLSTVLFYYTQYDSSGAIIVNQRYSNAKPNSDGYISKTFTFDNNSSYVNIGLGNDTVSTYYVENVQIEKGTTATDYEPYGASPSPEFPSEIKSVGDDVNLLDKDTPSRIDKEVVWKATETGGIYSTSAGWKAIGWNFELDTNSYYTFSYGKRNSYKLYLYIRTYTDNTFTTVKTMIVNDGTKLINTFKPDSKYVSILFQGSVSINNIEIPDIKFQKGTVATSYSEYGKGTVTIEQRGKNLFDASKIGNTDIIVSNNGQTITMPIATRANGYTTTNKKLSELCPSLKVGDKVILRFNTTSAINKYIHLSGITYTWVVNKELTITEKALNSYVILYANNYSGGETEQVTITDMSIMLSNEINIDYEPYFSKDYVIQTTPLRSLPNGTKDTIEEGTHRKVGQKILSANDISDLLTSYSIPCARIKKRETLGMPTINILNAVMMTSYSDAGKVNFQNTANGQFNAYQDRYYLNIFDERFTDLETAKSLLEGEEIIYELSEEVVEPFTDEQLEVLNSMITEKGTNIFDINEDTRITINYTPEFTDEIKHAFRYGVTRGYLEVLDGSELIINEDNYLQSIDFDDERYVDGEGIIGTTVAKSLEGKFVNVDSEFSVENKELQAYIGAELDDGTTKYIDLGTFIVQKPDNDNVKDNTSFTSLDYMVKFNQTYKDTITYPCTLGQLLQNVCAQVGIVLGTKTFRNSNFLVENNQFVNNESCREVLKAIAQMAFSWARINQDNELVLDFNLIDEPTAEFDYDEYYDLTSNEQYGPVNTIILKNSQVEGENYTVKNQDLIDEAGKEIALTISDNPFAYTQAKRSQLIQAGKELFGFKYIPFTTKTIGYIYLNCQDKIRIKNMQDKLLDSYLFNNKFSYEGSISDNKETSAMTETETKYQFTDTLENKLNAKIARTEIIVDKANQEITAVVEKQTEYDKSLTEIKAGLGSVTSTVEEIKNFKRSKRSTNEIYITDAMEDGTLSFTAIGNESVNVVLFPLNNLYPSDDLYGGNEYDG